MLPSTPSPGHWLPPLLTCSRTRTCLQKVSFLPLFSEPFTSAFSHIIFHILRKSLLSYFPHNLLPHFSALLCSNSFRRSCMYLLSHFQVLDVGSPFNSIHSGLHPHQLHCNCSCQGPQWPSCLLYPISTLSFSSPDQKRLTQQSSPLPRNIQFTWHIQHTTLLTVFLAMSQIALLKSPLKGLSTSLQNVPLLVFPHFSE